MSLKPLLSLQKPVFFDHDGSVDDFVALICLLTLDQYRITGISITNGNCHLDVATESTLRILSLFCRYDVEVAQSSALPMNPFPENWRSKSHFINKLKILTERAPDFKQLSKIDAVDFTAQKLLAETEKTIIVLTGPATNLVQTFERYPEVKNKVDKILWMAGAFMDDGNVKWPDHDGSAEWNIFWSPDAASALLESGVPVYMFPLDSCRQLPVDHDLMYNLKHSRKKLSKLVYQLFNPIFSAHAHYYMWDVLPAVYLGKPELFQFENTAISVEKRGTSVGNIYRSSNGSKVWYSKYISDQGFYDFLLNQLKQF
ncbi:MAG: nucleoside hydrolase [Prolixibacteraceae bacterium]|nr:nucleoside hydrolase [Prolixibacteraceae bacterium]